jgi:hypothetical protein
VCCFHFILAQVPTPLPQAGTRVEVDVAAHCDQLDPSGRGTACVCDVGWTNALDLINTFVFYSIQASQELFRFKCP